MQKTVKIGKKSVKLDNNIGWAMIYRNQFGHDIIPTLMPLVASAIDIVAGIINDTGKTEDITIEDLAGLVDGNAVIDAAVHLGGFEFVEVINITWALAKNTDDDIPEPDAWIKEFEVFPVDVVVPEVSKLIFRGLVSSKNLTRLKEIKSKLQPIENQSTLIPLDSQDSNED